MLASMRFVLLAATLVLAPQLLGCSIDPVITAPDALSSGRYDDCKRAARDFCRDVVGVGDAEERRCVSEHVYECVAGPPAPH